MIKKIFKIFYFQYHHFINKLKNKKHNKRTHQLNKRTFNKSEGDIKFSIIVPLYNTPEKYFCEMLNSVIRQSYLNWNIVLADASDNDKLEHIISHNYASEKRIIYVKLEKNMGIAGNTNQAFCHANGDYYVLLDHDDLLTVNALSEVYNVLITDSEIDLFYTDEDKYGNYNNNYFDPYYKGEPDVYQLRNNNYFCHMLGISKYLYKIVEGENSHYDGAQDYEFILRCFEQARKVKHVDVICYHWRVHEQSTAMNPMSKQYAYLAGERALQSHLSRSNIPAKVLQSKYPGFYDVQYMPDKNESIAFIVHSSKKSLKDLMKIGYKLYYFDNKKLINVETNSIESIKDVKYLIISNGSYSLNNKDCIWTLLGACQQPQIKAVSGKVVNSFGIAKKFNGIDAHHYLEILPFGKNMMTQSTEYINLDFCIIKLEHENDIDKILKLISHKTKIRCLSEVFGASKALFSPNCYIQKK